MRLTCLLLFFSVFCFKSSGQNYDTTIAKNALVDTFLNIISKYKANIGISVIAIEDQSNTSIGSDDRYPMQSVYKFPLAMAVLKNVDEGKLKLDQMVFVKKSELHNTWSPLKDKYPEGNVNISIAELLSYTISRSDNNTCDILFKLVGGPKAVNDYIHSLGFKKIAITATEYQMSKKRSIQYQNNTTPVAMAELLAGWYQSKFLSDSSTRFLNRIMVENYTSSKRLKGLLPDSLVVAHKTGTSGTNDKGISAATNDVGIICLPNGKHLAIAVFVSDSYENYETNERIIAEIALAAFRFYNHY